MSKSTWDIIEEQTPTAGDVERLRKALDAIEAHAPTSDRKVDLFKVVVFGAKSPERAAQVRAALDLRADATTEEAPASSTPSAPVTSAPAAPISSAPAAPISSTPAPAGGTSSPGTP